MSSVEALALRCILPGFIGTEAPDWVRRRAASGLGGLVLFARNVPDLGGRGRVDYVWPGPAPAVPRFEGFYGTGAADRTILPNQGVYFPQQHVGETITQTIEMQAESRPGGRDGVLRLWIDGCLLTNATGVALGTEGVNRVLIPSTFRASAQDQTEYYWAFLAWTPKS